MSPHDKPEWFDRTYLMIVPKDVAIAKAKTTELLWEILTKYGFNSGYNDSRRHGHYFLINHLLSVINSFEFADLRDNGGNAIRISDTKLCTGWTEVMKDRFRDMFMELGQIEKTTLVGKILISDHGNELVISKGGEWFVGLEKLYCHLLDNVIHIYNSIFRRVSDTSKEMLDTELAKVIESELIKVMGLIPIPEVNVPGTLEETMCPNCTEPSSTDAPTPPTIADDSNTAKMVIDGETVVLTDIKPVPDWICKLLMKFNGEEYRRFPNTTKGFFYNAIESVIKACRFGVKSDTKRRVIVYEENTLNDAFDLESMDNVMRYMAELCSCEKHPSYAITVPDGATDIYIGKHTRWVNQLLDVVIAVATLVSKLIKEDTPLPNLGSNKNYNYCYDHYKMVVRALYSSIKPSGCNSVHPTTAETAPLTSVDVTPTSIVDIVPITMQQKQQVTLIDPTSSKLVHDGEPTVNYMDFCPIPDNWIETIVNNSNSFPEKPRNIIGDMACTLKTSSYWVLRNLRFGWMKPHIRGTAGCSQNEVLVCAWGTREDDILKVDDIAKEFIWLEGYADSIAFAMPTLPTLHSYYGDRHTKIGEKQMDEFFCAVLMCCRHYIHYYGPNNNDLNGTHPLYKTALPVDVCDIKRSGVRFKVINPIRPFDPDTVTWIDEKIPKITIVGGSVDVEKTFGDIKPLAILKLISKAYGFKAIKLRGDCLNYTLSTGEEAVVTVTETTPAGDGFKVRPVYRPIKGKCLSLTNYPKKNGKDIPFYKAIEYAAALELINRVNEFTLLQSTLKLWKK